jgi:hypothetical protein
MVSRTDDAAVAPESGIGSAGNTAEGDASGNAEASRGCDFLKNDDPDIAFSI